MSDDLIESYLGAWARWHRASYAERRALWYAPVVVWARRSVTNYMTAEDDAEALDDLRHAELMGRIDAAVSDLDDAYRSAIYQAHGLGSLASVKWGEDSLRWAFEAAKDRLRPLLLRRGVVT